MQAQNREYPNGETRLGEAQSRCTEHIGTAGERGELKHLSTRRKREYSPSSGERKGNSPNQTDFGEFGVVGPTELTGS